MATCLEVCSEDMCFTGYLIFHPKDVPSGPNPFLIDEHNLLTTHQWEKIHTNWSEPKQQMNYETGVSTYPGDFWHGSRPMTQRFNFLSLSLLPLWPRTCCLTSLNMSFLMFRTRSLAKTPCIWRMLRANPWPLQPGHREEATLWFEFCCSEEFIEPLLMVPFLGIPYAWAEPLKDLSPPWHSDPISSSQKLQWLWHSCTLILMCGLALSQVALLGQNILSRKSEQEKEQNALMHHIL